MEAAKNGRAKIMAKTGINAAIFMLDLGKFERGLDSSGGVEIGGSGIGATLSIACKFILKT
jgi:hypothetical protein